MTRLEASIETLRKDMIAIGMEQGLNKKNIETATKMLNKGYNIPEIAEITDLSEEKLQELNTKKA